METNRCHYRKVPIANVISIFIEKKSGKVIVSHDEIQRRFFGLDWETQKHILKAFLALGKTDRNWAYSELFRIWDDSFETKVLGLWETFPEERGASRYAMLEGGSNWIEGDTSASVPF